MVTFEVATAEHRPAVEDNQRRRTLRTADGKLFIGKNDYCQKTPGHKNTVWLVNEIICAEYAHAASLRVPEQRLLTCSGREYLGSEFLPARRTMTKGDSSVGSMNATGCL